MSDQALPQQLARILQVHARIVQDFMTRRNVVACGVGYKVQGDHETTVPSLVVSVTRKEPPQVLPPRDLIPQMVEDVPTDVIETGEIHALGIDRRVALRPVRPGMSIGHIKGTAGTIGAIVQRGRQRFILGNNHVLALLNQAQLGDPILQPGPSDGGTLADKVAELAAFVPLRFMSESVPPISEPAEEPASRGCGALAAGLLKVLGKARQSVSTPTTAPPVPLSASMENRLDAALAIPTNDTPLDPRIIDIGGPPVGITDPQLGQRVVKSGRTTGLTEGVIVQINATVDVKYGDRTARFVRQIMISPFSQRGDSGALVLDYQRRAIGMLFSGSELIAVASPIRDVLSALNVELVTE